MELLSYLLIIVSLLMYLEGGLVTGLICLATRPPRWAVFFYLLCWPFVLPYLGYKGYKAALPIIEQIKQFQQLQANPLMGAMMNINLEEQNKDQVGQIL